MRHQLLIIGASCLLGAGACKKNEANPGTGTATAGGAAPVAKPADTPATPPPPPSPSGCSATAWKEPSGLFCIDAPGFKAEVEQSEEFGPDDPTMNVTFTRPEEPGKPELEFSVVWYPKRDVSEKEDIDGQFDGDFKDEIGEDKGEFAAGKGRYIVVALKDEPKAHRLKSAVQGAKRFYKCSAKSYDAPIAPEVLAACKSLTPTD